MTTTKREKRQQGLVSVANRQEQVVEFSSSSLNYSFYSGERGKV